MFEFEVAGFRLLVKIYLEKDCRDGVQLAANSLALSL